MYNTDSTLQYVVDLHITDKKHENKNNMVSSMNYNL